MPEMHFAIRWPDGTEASYYSPSLVMHDFLTVGSRYPVAEFVSRSDEALGLASERVQAKFGFACTSAMQSINEIRADAAAHRADAAAHLADGDVEVIRMEPPLEGASA